MRQRGLAHSDRFREFPLVSRRADLQVEQDQPDRQGAARFGQGLVEGALDGPGRLVQAEPDRDRKRFRRVTKRTTSQRYLSV
jgi:hypothetical protein